MSSETISMPIEGELRSIKDVKQAKIEKVALKDKKLVIDFNEVYIVVGIRGFGKSYFVKKAILPLINHAVFFDHTEGYPDDGVTLETKEEKAKYKGWYIAHTERELFDLLMKQRKKENKKKPFYIVYRPKYGSLAAHEWFCMAIMAFGDVLCVDDEMADFCSPQKIGMEHSRLLRVGRHRNIGYCGITQRPASVHNTFKSQCTKGFAFRLNLPPDVKYMKEWWGEEMEVIRTLPHFHYIIWDQTRLIKMKPIKEKEEPIIIEEKPKTAIGVEKASEQDRDDIIEIIEETEEEYD